MSQKAFAHVDLFTLDHGKARESYEDVMTKTTQNMLAEVRKLAADISSRAAEIETLRQLTIGPG